MMFKTAVSAPSERKYAGLALDDVALDGTFSGYASLFGAVDLGKDAVERGAFAGALDGLSIGFRTLRARREAASGIRRILEADLWEISVVTFPMLPGARVAQVKAGRSGAPNPRDFERWLRRDAGLSRREARLVIAESFNALRSPRDAGGDASTRLAERIREAADLFT